MGMASMGSKDPQDLTGSQLQSPLEGSDGPFPCGFRIHSEICGSQSAGITGSSVLVNVPPMLLRAQSYILLSTGAAPLCQRCAVANVL